MVSEAKTTSNDDRHNSLRLDNRRFTYSEIEAITNGFKRVIGKGGFGEVYDGYLEDGTQVAVKLLSETSEQGEPEFLAEVSINETCSSVSATAAAIDLVL